MSSRPSHRLLLAAFAGLAAILGLASLALAVLSRMGRVHLSHAGAIGLIAAWMFLAPPLSIITRVWVYTKVDEPERERIERVHAILRSLWLGLVVLLVVLVGGGGISFRF